MLLRYLTRITTNLNPSKISVFNVSFHKINIANNMSGTSYELAVTALNGLQSNAAYIQKARVERNHKPDKNITDTIRYLQVLQVLLQEVDSLNIIHVAGTKGKGSTCAFTEAILRNHGYKTGFYSSPHLVSVNERIRINGLPLSKEKFAVYFWEVYNTIQKSLEENEHMPTYFMFLTIMAFYVFLKEQVEATVIEVGIGGLYDCTNIVRKPIVVGITTLGIDHVSLLGTTLTEIAAQKAGIFKPNVPAFTVSQPENAMNVLRTKAQTIGCSLALSPPLETYECKIALGAGGSVQNINASLALQLSQYWLGAKKHKSVSSNSLFECSKRNLILKNEFSAPLLMANTFQLSSETKTALENCTWPGRFQILEKKNTTFYLDGAHTPESIKYCKRWFKEISQKQAKNYKSPVLRILLFNCTGERKAENLLDPFTDVNFDIIMFSPNKITLRKESSSDLSNFMIKPGQEMQQCLTNKETWCHLIRSLYENKSSRAFNGSNELFDNSVESDYTDGDCSNVLVFPSITHALNFISVGDFQNQYTDNKKITDMINQASHKQILVTGSLHLVGGVLSIIQQ